MGHAVPLWAGVSAFFGNAVALKVADALNGGDAVKFAGILVTSIFVGLAVYAKQRLDEARKERNGKG